MKEVVEFVSYVVISIVAGIGVGLGMYREVLGNMANNSLRLAFAIGTGVLACFLWPILFMAFLLIAACGVAYLVVLALNTIATDTIAEIKKYQRGMKGES